MSFFAYPGKPSDLVPEGCQVHVLAEYRGAAAALERLADEVAPGTPGRRWHRRTGPELPAGALTAASAAAVIGALLPEGAIVVDESNTAGRRAAPPPRPARRRTTVLTLTGGAIGYGLPAAVGAAVAAPGPPVLSLQADGVGDVHHLGAVDAGPRAAGRDHGDLQQRRLRHPADRAAAGRRRRTRARPGQGAGAARSRLARQWIS